LLLISILLTVPLTSVVVVYPGSIETLSSSDLGITVHNSRQAYLVNVTLSLPLQLTPVGFNTNSGRWYTSATAGRDSYRVEWLGAVASGKTVLLGAAVTPTGGPRVLELTIRETYDDGTSTNSTQSISLVCPCFFGVDVRYAAYGAIGLVLLLPAIEVMLHRTKVLKRQSS
jgi:hypothetical protein